MNVPGNMAVMNAAGGAVGPAPVMNQAVGRAHFEPDEQKRLNTYIYDYLLKLEKFDLARTFQQQCQIAIKQSTSPGRGVNGVDDMDTDSKDAVLKRPADLPIPELPGLSDNTTCFLYEWWCQFWDVYGARSKMSPAKANMVTVEYLQYNYMQTKGRQNLHQHMLQPGMVRGQYNTNMIGQPNGVAMTNDMKRPMPNTRNATPQQMQQMAQAKMLQNPMQRDGSNMEMGGQRSNSPGSMDNAPSPSKRPRLEGGNGFNGQQMGPAGRGQSISVSQMNNLNAAAGPNAGMMLPNGVPDLQQQQLAFAGQTASMQQKQMEVMNANLPQGSQLPGAAMDGIDFSTINGGRMGAAGANQTGNHALQDYQMQLMLLEQQNKKRLLMARQEQDNMVQSHAGSGANPQFAMAASMSPSQSRAGGPSPNPNEMKRVASTPKLGQGVPGSPMPDMQNRGSPAPGFDPNQIVQGMHPAMYNQMAAGMARPPSSHPGAAFPMGGLTQQNIEAIRRNGGLPNGQPFPQGGPQMLQQNMQNPQQPPPQINTPQQRHGTMPPPRAPASQEPQRTQPSSPAQNQAPQTPSQNPKSVPKGKKENKAAAKKNPSKKQSTTTATPATENAEPPTPTPSTPITPRHPDSFNKQQNGNNATNAQPPNAAANPPQPGPTQQPAAPAAPTLPVAATASATLDFDANQEFGLNFADDIGSSAFNLDFATSLDTTDVLDNFDFDSLLNTDGGLPFGE